MRAQVTAIVAPGRAARAPGRALPYTSRTKRVFALAGESARALGHVRVGVEHLLLGLMRERLGIGAQVLAQHGLTEERTLERAQRSGAEGSTL